MVLRIIVLLSYLIVFGGTAQAKARCSGIDIAKSSLLDSLGFKHIAVSNDSVIDHSFCFSHNVRPLVVAAADIEPLDRYRFAVWNAYSLAGQHVFSVIRGEGEFREIGNGFENSENVNNRRGSLPVVVENSMSASIVVKLQSDGDSRTLHVDDGRSVQSHPMFLTKQSDKLQTTHDDQSRGKRNEPPIGRRFFVFACSAIAGIALGIWGVGKDVDGYPFVGRVAIVFALLLYLFGGFLWWATGFPSTWGWLL